MVVFFDEFIVVNGADVSPGANVIVPVWGGVAFLTRQMATTVTFPVFVIFHEYVLFTVVQIWSIRTVTFGFGLGVVGTHLVEP